MKGKKLLAGILSAAMVLGTTSISVFADETGTVSPDWDADGSAKVFAYGTDANGGFTLYADTLTKALNEIYKKTPTGTTTIECKPGEDVGSMQHGHVADDLVINGNGAYVSGGEYDLEIDTYTYDRTKGTNVDSNKSELTKDINVTVNNLNQIAAWGERRSNVTINLKFNGCKDMNRVYFSGNTGINNITITDCSFSDKTGGSSSNTSIYSNAKGQINLDNVSFTNVAVPINLKNKSDGTQTINVKNCNFTNCATAEIAKKTGSTLYAAPIRVVTEGSAKASNVTVSSCTFTECATAGNGTILLGDGRKNEISTPNVTLNVSGTEAEIQVQEPNKRDTPAVKKKVAAADSVSVAMPSVAEINGIKYATVADAISAAQDNGIITIFGEITLKDFDFTTSAKNVTIKGADEKAVLKLSGACKGTDMIFENLTMEWTNGNYQGIQHSNNLVYNNVTIKGQPFLYAANETFKNCKFYQDYRNEAGKADAYNVWTYGAKNVEFDNCEFNSIGKSVLVYAEAKGVSTVVNVKDCTFKASESVSGKAAIEIDSSLIPGEYTLNISGNTTATGFDNGSVSGNTLYNVKKYKTKKQDDNSFKANSTITVDGKDVAAVPFKAKVIDEAKTTGATVKLDSLHENIAINLMEDSTYQTVIETAPSDDAAKANAAIEKNEMDTNTSKLLFDIFVMKTDSNSNQSKVDVKNQSVTYTVEEPIAAGCTVKVYHVDGEGNVAEVTDVKCNGQNISFIAPSFSTYAVTYTADNLDDDKITKNISVDFEPVTGTSSYDIVLKAAGGKKINRFMSADLTFDINIKEGNVGYTITPAANTKISDLNDGRYEFNMDGTNASGATGDNITIGTVKFEGTGKVDFGIKTANTNIVNTAKSKDNIVEYNTTTGDGITTGKLDLSKKLTDVELKAPTKELTVKVTFNNAISDNVKEYQDMKAVISGGDLSDDITVDFGSDATKLANNVYTFTKALTKNTAYTVTVSGAGYRTARYTVTMTDDKTLNFWNNVKNTAINVEEGVTAEATKKNVTFLAGDIVKDGTINIYDLSAVVSYFGTNNLVSEHLDYAKYDLNRDGKIDSKDVAYVLVSWGK